MHFLYNILISFTEMLLPVTALFNGKMKRFVTGRKETLKCIKKALSPGDKVIWFHCASLGEFEQGRPVIEKLKVQYPDHKMVLTFFSPSGYEIRKHYEMADVVCYLPLDTKSNAKKFLNIVQPVLAVFVKYEFWPNFLNELNKRDVQTLLISAIFRKNQVFFKSFGGWMRKSLKAFSHFFVQDPQSEVLLNSIGFNNVTVSGDTRFDRVYEILNTNNHLDFIDEFRGESYTLVAGSTWKDDEALLVNYINEEASDDEKFIIAPHNIDQKDIEKLQYSIHKKVILYSDKKDKKLSEYQVFIVNTIGILTKIYNFADVAYVGGGFTKTGVHNILEPATFGLPIIIGPHYNNFKEAKDLIAAKACFSIRKDQDFQQQLKKFSNDKLYRKEVGERSYNYVLENIGATQLILNYIQNEDKIR